MANTLLTPSIIAKEAIMVLINNLVAGNLVHKGFSTEFAEVGDSITVRKPTNFVAKDFVEGTDITLQNATETGVTLTLNKFKDVSFSVTSKDLALNINDFSLQFLQPAMRALAQQIDSDILFVANDFSYTYVRGAVPEISDWANADKILNDNQVPITERNAVLCTAHNADYLAIDNLVKVSESGSVGALRNANIGRVMGFETYWSQNMPKSDDSKDQSLLFHQNAIALITAPLDTKGSEFMASENFQGVTIRVAQDYDIKSKNQIFSLDCLYGVKVLDNKLGARLVSA